MNCVRLSVFILLSLFLGLPGCGGFVAAGPGDDGGSGPTPAAGASEHAKPAFTEEVEVSAEAPKAHPVSATVEITPEKIESLAPRDLSQLMSFAPGTYVSVGSKYEYGLKIRGLDTQKIALLYDGIPIYEPYFGSFDLKTILTEDVEDVKIVKGATSVLYGPNVLGGAVNVITRRPQQDSLRLSGAYGSFEAVDLGVTGTVRRGDFGFVGSMAFNRANEWDYVNSAGDHVQRDYSDYRRESATGKFYWIPSDSSEFMAEVSYYNSDYGIPAATEIYRARYWRFPDWDRLLVGIGGSFPLSSTARMKVRGYYVRYHNILDAYIDPAMQDRDWRSTYNNYSYGVYALGSWFTDPRNEVKFSVNLKSDHARQQDDLNEPWYGYSEDTFSTGVEDHFSLAPQWTLVGGVSLDYLRKEVGNNKAAVNPLAGIRFAATSDLGLYASFSQKSRFPNMRALYGSIGGNPDLQEERGTNWELGADWGRDVTLHAAVFYNKVRDLIQSVRLPDGYNTYINVGRAHITGFELSVEKKMDWLRVSANYTYLDAVNEDAAMPLPLVPQSQANAVVDFLPAPNWRVTLWGLAASRCQTLNRNDVVEAAGYFLANAGVARKFQDFELYAQVENLLDKGYVTEPGYPMPSRTFKLGLRWNYNRD
jgi:outer membrane receptor protein involved in Fe transport